MSSIDVSINNNVVTVAIDNRYIGSSDIPKEFNGCFDESAFIEAVSDSIKEAIDDAMEKMWPDYGDRYYFPSLNSDCMYNYHWWAGYKSEKILKRRGLVFKTKEEAIEVAKKMLEAIK